MDIFKNPKAITGLALFLIAIATFFFLDTGLWDKIQQTNGEIDIARQKLALAQDLVGVVTELNLGFSDIPKEAERIEFALPSRAEVPEILIQISSLASQNGLVLKKINFGTAGQTGSGGYVPIDITLQIAGNYEALKTFIVAIEQNLRIIDVENLSFSVSQDSDDPINFNMSLTTYYQ